MVASLTGPATGWEIENVKAKAIAVVCVLAFAGVVAWFATMPYPIRLWWEARKVAQYSKAWPIPRQDYVEAKRLVGRRMGFREIINQVTIVSPSEIRFATLLSWDGPVASSGQSYVVKKVDGKWRIAEQSMWILE